MTEPDVSIYASGLAPEFELVGVRIVATLGNDGGAIVETPRKLQCSEGRLYSFERTNQGELHQLEYNFSFWEHADADPMASRGLLGRIVITGRHSNGHRLEIRGDGWIGYDEKGRVEGRFDTPPVIITEDWEAVAADEDLDSEDDQTARDPIDFPMPPQFTQADVRVPAREEWDD